MPCALNGGRPIAHTELGVDAPDVRVDRVDRDVELSRDLRPRQVCRQISQYAEFARAELLGLRQPRSFSAISAPESASSIAAHLAW